MDRVLTVTVIDDSSTLLRDEDRGAADIVIYGFRPVRPAKTEPTPDASPDHAPGDPAPPEPLNANPEPRVDSAGSNCDASDWSGDVNDVWGVTIARTR